MGQKHSSKPLILPAPSDLLTDNLTREVIEEQNPTSDQPNERLPDDLIIEEQTPISDRPIERLPDDLIREIFLHCLPDQRQDITLLSHTPPVLLTRVCRHWRDVAVDFSLLWKWIQVYLPDPPLHQDVLHTLVRMFERAKVAPFNLQVIHPTDIGPDNFIDRIQDDLLDRLVVPVGQSLTRLTLVRIRPSQLLSLTSDQFPSLERLVLFFEECDMFDWQEWDENGPIKAFEGVSSLRYAAIKELFMLGEHKNQSNIALPTGLTHFVLGVTGGRNVPSNFLIKYLIPKSKNLRSLHVRLDDEDKGFDGGQIPSECLELESIESLTLEYHWGITDSLWMYPAIFDKVRLPNLRRLRFEGDHVYLNRWAPADTERFIKKLASLDQLEYFSFRCVHYTLDKHLDRILKNVGRITTLHIELCEFTALFEMLTLRGSGGLEPKENMLPQLETLVLDIVFRYPLDPVQWVATADTPFIKFIESRIPRGLRRLIFCGFEDETTRWKVDKKIRGWLQSYFTSHGGQHRLDFETYPHKDFPEYSPDMYDWAEARSVLRRVYDYRDG